MGPGEERSESRLKQGEAVVWQRRYWEHMIWDEDDLRRHEDYIHYNPLKHGLVQRVADWRWSSFHQYVRMGYYERDWGGAVRQEVDGMRCGE
jgi:putative transposase